MLRRAARLSLEATSVSYGNTRGRPERNRAFADCGTPIWAERSNARTRAHNTEPLESQSAREAKSQELRAESRKRKAESQEAWKRRLQQRTSEQVEAESQPQEQVEMQPSLWGAIIGLDATGSLQPEDATKPDETRGNSRQFEG